MFLKMIVFFKQKLNILLIFLYVKFFNNLYNIISWKMGRKKLQIKYIEPKKLRNVTYKKRVKGLLRKTAELSILCNINITMKIINQKGQPIQFITNKDHKNDTQIKQIHQLYTSEQYPNFENYLWKQANKPSEVDRKQKASDVKMLQKTQIQQNVNNEALNMQYYYNNMMMNYYRGFQ